jgi:hypothetical protein
MVVALTWFPDANQLVVRLPGWPVMLFPDWPLARYMVTVIMDIGLIEKSIGSV